MQFLINTIVLASIYGLIAVGYVIIYRTSRVINFAHGDLMTLGAYFFYSTLTITGSQSWEGKIGVFFLSLLMSFCVALIIYRLFIHKMIGQPIYIMVMVTIALGVILHSLIILVWGSEPKILSTSLGIQNPPIAVGRISLSRFDLVSIVTFLGILAGLGLFYKYFKTGVHSRAASENPLLTSQRGLNIYYLFAFSWGLSILLASIAGILYGINKQADPSLSFLGLKAMPVAIVGGMYSLIGIVPGAVLISLSENIIATYFDPLVSDVVPMVILLVVLIGRPWGIFGKEEEIERV